MRFSKLSLVAALVALTVVGLAIEATALKVSPKVGDVRKYKMTGKMDVGGNDASVSATITDKVTKVEDNGNVTTVSSQSNMVIEFGGQTIPAPDQTETNVVKPDGTVVELKGESIGANEYRLATINTVKLPDFALEKDKTWTWDCPADSKTGVVHTKGEYKVLGDEKLHDIDTWKISTNVKELEGDTPASTVATVWLSKTDGTMVKVDGKATNLPISGAPSPPSGTIKIEMVP